MWLTPIVPERERLRQKDCRMVESSQGYSGRDCLKKNKKQKQLRTKINQEISTWWAWWNTPLVPALGRQRQVYVCGNKASPIYIMDSSQGYVMRPSNR